MLVISRALAAACISYGAEPNSARRIHNPGEGPRHPVHMVVSSLPHGADRYAGLQQPSSGSVGEVEEGRGMRLSIFESELGDKFGEGRVFRFGSVSPAPSDSMP